MQKTEETHRTKNWSRGLRTALTLFGLLLLLCLCWWREKACPWIRAEFDEGLQYWREAKLWVRCLTYALLLLVALGLVYLAYFESSQQASTEETQTQSRIVYPKTYERCGGIGGAHLVEDPLNQC